MAETKKTTTKENVKKTTKVVKIISSKKTPVGKSPIKKTPVKKSTVIKPTSKKVVKKSPIKKTITKTIVKKTSVTKPTKIKSLEDEIKERQIKAKKNQKDASSSSLQIEITGPIMNGHFINDKNLFSGNIEVNLTTEEEEIKKRSKFNTNYEEREEALRTYKEAKEKAISAAAELENATNNLSKTKELSKIKDKRTREEHKIKKINQDYNRIHNIAHNKLEKMNKSSLQTLNNINQIKVQPIEEKIRMEVKNIDQIVHSLNKNETIEKDEELKVDLTPFSDAFNGKEIKSSIKEGIISKLNLAKNKNGNFSSNPEDTVIMLDVDGNIVEPIIKQPKRMGDTPKTSGIKMVDDILSQERNIFNNISNSSIENNNSKLNPSPSQGENDLATLEELSGQKVGGVGKPTMGGLGNYVQQPLRHEKNVNNNSNIKVDYDYSNKKPQIQKSLQPIFKAPHKTFSFRKKSSNNEMSALEQYKKQHKGPSGYMNKQSSLNEDFMNKDNNVMMQGGGISNPIMDKFKGYGHRRQVPVPKKTIRFRNPLANISMNRSINNRNDPNATNQKILKKEIIQNYKKLNYMEIDGMTRKTNYGNMYNESLGKENSKLIEQRRKEEKKRQIKNEKRRMKLKRNNLKIKGIKW